MFDHNFKELKSLAQLNGVLALPNLGLTNAFGAALGFNPTISPQTFTIINIAQTPHLTPIPGVNVAILDHVIEADRITRLYQGMKYREVIRPLAAALPAAINTVQPTYTYWPHGDKHFPRGTDGTKFATPLPLTETSVKDAVNRLLEQLIRPEIGRIRRNANGQDLTYYYTVNSADTNPTDAQTSKNLEDFLTISKRDSRITEIYPLTIQVDYFVGPPEVFRYHGYPDNGVIRYSLARFKNGQPI